MTQLDHAFAELEAKAIAVEVHKVFYQTFNDVGEAVTNPQYRRIQVACDLVVNQLDNLYNTISEIQFEIEVEANS